MATSSIKAPIRVSESGAKALCDAYEKGMEEEARSRNTSRGFVPSSTVAKKEEMDLIFSLLRR